MPTSLHRRILTGHDSQAHNQGDNWAIAPILFKNMFSC